MHIRTAETRDLQVITNYNLRLAKETENLDLDPKVVTAGVAALLADRAKGIYFVAEVVENSSLTGTSSSDSTVMGQLCITYEWSDWRNGNFWWIQSVYVKKEFRGCGIFTGLFKHVKKLARERGDVCGVRLYMEQDNETARRTYQKAGMIETHYRMFEGTVS